MPVTTLSSQELNRDIARAKEAALAGPVFIADGDAPSHVLLSIVEYRRLAAQTRRRGLLDALAMPGDEDIEFEPPKLDIEIRPADLS